MTPKQKWILVGIIFLAIFFRYFQIMAMPGGLFPDEAANGIDINLMQQGHIQPFYERGNGREALFFYMLWGSVEVFGKGYWQHHIVSAGVGVLAVLGCFLVAKQLFLLYYKREESATNLALWAAFFMAASSWHIVLSRTAFRANLIPLFTAYTFYFMLLAYRSTDTLKRYFWSLLAGISFALGFYTYIAYRIMVPLVFLIIVWPFFADLIRNRAERFAQIKKFFVPSLVLTGGFLVFIYPLVQYFIKFPDAFIGRSGQVSVFNPELNGGNLIATIAEVFLQSMKAYFWNGDLNWRHNISGEPFLAIFISPFFAIGMLTITILAARYTFSPFKHKADWIFFLLAGWFWSMLLPVVTTAEGIPHGLRSIGTIPVVFIASALGITLVYRTFKILSLKYWSQIKQWQRQLLTTARGLLFATFIIAVVLNPYILYFVKAANGPENFYSFRSDLSVVSEYLNANGDSTNTYLILDKFSVQTVEYFTSDAPKKTYTQVDPEDSWQLTGLTKGSKIVFTQSSLFDIKKFKQYHPNAKLTSQAYNKFGQTVMAIYVIE